MTWLLMAIANAVVSGLVSWGIVRRFGRTSILAWLAVPVSLSLLTFVIAFQVAIRLATCNSPDCGAIEFVAGLVFAAAMSVGSFLGAVVGVWRAARGFNRG